MVNVRHILELSCTLADIERRAIYLPISYTNIARLLLRYQPDECRPLADHDVLRMVDSHMLLQQWLEKGLACFQPYYFVSMSCGSYSAIHTLQGILLDAIADDANRGGYAKSLVEKYPYFFGEEE